MTARRYAVIGSGVSGLVAAHVLSCQGEVTLYEADDRLGGHADTHEVSLDGRTLAVDTGFIVHNDRTYPTLQRLFAELGIATQETDMSMSVRCDADGIEYSGGRGISGLVPTAGHLARPRYLKMLTEVTRFHRAAREVLESSDESGTLGDFLAEHDFGDDFRRWFMTPLVAAVWSCAPADSERYPARHLFTFLDHHGMLGVTGSPAWRTVVGGSRTYVDAVAAGLHEVRISAPVTAVREVAGGVEVTANGETITYDAVVIAAHAPAALQMLAEPTQQQREVLAAFTYSQNIARLHTDDSLLPRTDRARASWNYLVPQSDRAEEVVVTYDMTRLQRLTAAGDTRLLVTLGGEDLIDPSRVLDTMHYEHPLFTAEAVAAQERLPQINSNRLAFAGAWQAWGFHEDGALSGLRAAERLGAHWDTPEVEIPTPLPRIYETTIKHKRRAPLEHAFTYRSATWLVDLDHLPDHGVLARFEARDHIGDPSASIRSNIDAFLAEHGIDLAGGRVLMLAMPRTAGHCFNPISVHWCYAADGTLAGVVVEVHNTYRGRHAYLVQPDGHGNARVGKELYVSPFNDTSGTYRVHVPEPGDRVDVAVTLEREGHPPFVATMRGEGHPATLANVRRFARAYPVTTLVNSARIRRHGIALWAKGLKVQPRPDQPGRRDRDAVISQSGRRVARELATERDRDAVSSAPTRGVEGPDQERWPDLAPPRQNVRTRAGAAIAEQLLKRAASALGVQIVTDADAVDSDKPTMIVRRPDDFFGRVGRDGLIGFGEAWMAGDWDADDPAAVLTVFARKMDSLVPQPLQRLRGWYVARQPHSDRGTVDNSRSNISRHYDLSNDLFETFLDPTMTYSSAWFAQHGDMSGDFAPEWVDLEKAQLAKIERLLDQAHVGDGTRLLEIGSGWGELAIQAARRGAQVTTITLSTEQQSRVRERLAGEGLSDRVSVELLDYRQVEGTFDAVVSVEMIEAVGLDHLPEYFETINRVLAPGGRAAIQAITMADERMLATKDTYTWVHKYVFPGGLIPSVEAIERSLVDTSLSIADDFRMGAHYAQTLRLWEERFLQQWPTVRELGFDETFRRMWQFYLAYSRAGFASGYLDVRQLVLEKS